MKYFLPKSIPNGNGTSCLRLKRKAKAQRHKTCKYLAIEIAKFVKEFKHFFVALSWKFPFHSCDLDSFMLRPAIKYQSTVDFAALQIN